jgi:glucose-1-phosphate adenylyltransferase
MKVISILNLHTPELQGVQEAERPSEGFYIRSGVTVVLKNSIIEDGLVI